jgi:N-formylglutamate amidohydrolase
VRPCGAWARARNDARARTDARVLSIMIEINRGLYVHEETGQRLPDFDTHRAAIQRVVRTITESAARHCSEEHP